MFAVVAAPVVGAAALAGEILTAISLVILAIVALALLYWVLGAARNAAGNVPVVGARVIVIIDSLRKATLDLMRQRELEAIHGVHSIARGIVGLIAMVVSVPLAELNRAVAAHEAELAANAVWRGQADAGVHLAVDVLIPELRSLLEQNAVWRAQADAGIHLLADVLVPAIRRELDANAVWRGQADAGLHLVADVQVPALQAAVGVLGGYLPLLRGLEAFETGAAGGIRTLRRDVDLARADLDHARELLRELAKLLTLAGLGAVAIDMLARLARDPCAVVTLGCFPDLEDRVEALENGGH